MPLERKVLLSIFISLFLLLTGYLIFDYYNPKYLDAKEKITQYKKLINNHKDVESEITEEEITKLEELITSYKESFFTKEESKVVNTTPVIKKLLEKSGIKISQYQGNKSSVRFTIRGDIKALRDFLYTLSKENKYYDFPLFNIRMIDNNSFQGNIEILRKSLTDNPNERHYIEEVRVKNNKPTYSREALSPLGTTFYTPIVVKKEAQISKPDPKPENLPLNKFRYVGLLKSQDGVITMFKENTNGRVYRFKAGQTLSEWTYIGEENGKFLFKKDNLIYEVLP